MTLGLRIPNIPPQSHLLYSHTPPSCFLLLRLVPPLLIPHCCCSKLASMSHLCQHTVWRSTGKGDLALGWEHPGDPIKLPRQTQVWGVSGHGLGAVEKRKEPWMADPLPAFHACGLHWALGIGRKSGQRKCGDCECQETELGLEIRKGRDPSGLLLRNCR